MQETVAASLKQVINRSEARQVRLTPDADALLLLVEGACRITQKRRVTTSDLIRRGLRNEVLRLLDENPEVAKVVRREWAGKIEEVRF